MGALKYILGLQDELPGEREHFEKLAREEENRINQIFNRDCTEPPTPSRYDHMTRAEKEDMMLDTIYEMAKTIERLNAKIERLEGDIQQIKEDAAEARHWAFQAS